MTCIKISNNYNKIINKNGIKFSDYSVSMIYTRQTFYFNVINLRILYTVFFIFLNIILTSSNYWKEKNIQTNWSINCKNTDIKMDKKFWTSDVLILVKSRLNKY